MTGNRSQMNSPCTCCFSLYVFVLFVLVRGVCLVVSHPASQFTSIALHYDMIHHR